MADPIRTCARAATVAASLLLLCLTACDGKPPAPERDEAGEEDAFRPVPVEVAPVVAADLRATVGTSTTLRSAREVAVVSEIAGTVREVSVETGDTVQVGQVLARVVNDEVGISIGEAETALARAEREVARLRPLHDAGYIAAQVFDQATFEVETAQTQLRRLRTQAADQTVRAGAAGVVTQRTVEAGQVVVPNQALFMVSDVSALEALVAVPERELGRLREGQVAELTVEAFGEEPFTGEVVRIEPTVDPRTGTVQLRVAIDATADQDRRLRPGMFTQVRIVTDVHEGVPAVPKRAVLREAEDTYVFVVGEAVERPPADGSGDPGPLDHLTPYAVTKVPVSLGYDDLDTVELVDGPAVGARVIVVGQGGLDDDAIIVVPAESDAPADG